MWEMGRKSEGGFYKTTDINDEIENENNEKMRFGVNGNAVNDNKFDFKNNCENHKIIRSSSTIRIGTMKRKKFEKEMLRKLRPHCYRKKEKGMDNIKKFDNEITQGIHVIHIIGRKEPGFDFFLLKSLYFILQK